MCIRIYFFWCVVCVQFPLGTVTTHSQLRVLFLFAPWLMILLISPLSTCKLLNLLHLRWRVFEIVCWAIGSTIFTGCVVRAEWHRKTSMIDISTWALRTNLPAQMTADFKLLNHFPMQLIVYGLEGIQRNGLVLMAPRNKHSVTALDHEIVGLESANFSPICHVHCLARWAAGKWQPLGLSS